MPHQTFFKSQLTTRVDDAVTQERTDTAAWLALCRLVDGRDERSCRCCGKRTNADAVGLLRGHRHHVIYRSAGGPNATWNLATLCASCHNEEHVKKTLHVEGNADLALRFWKRGEDGELFLWRREIAVRVFEKD
jgi:5-methylcytosine-specific restriction endonuclease McrA